MSGSVFGDEALVASILGFFAFGVPSPLGKSGSSSIIRERAVAAVVGLSASIFSNKLHWERWCWQLVPWM